MKTPRQHTASGDGRTAVFSVSMKLTPPSKNTWRLWRPDAMPTFQIFRPKKFHLPYPKISATPQRPWLAWAAALRQPLGHFCVSATPTKSATSIEPCHIIRNTGDHEAHSLRTFVVSWRQFWERGVEFQKHPNKALCLGMNHRKIWSLTQK